jgi:hypothetical protein
LLRRDHGSRPGAGAAGSTGSAAGSVIGDTMSDRLLLR